MKKSTKTLRLVQLGLLIAVELIFAYTPLGYMKPAGLEITFLMVPVTIGAILLGPAAGAILGGVFGLTSFSTVLEPAHLAQHCCQLTHSLLFLSALGRASLPAGSAASCSRPATWAQKKNRVSFRSL